MTVEADVASVNSTATTVLLAVLAVIVVAFIFTAVQARRFLNSEEMTSKRESLNLRRDTVLFLKRYLQEDEKRFEERAAKAHWPADQIAESITQQNDVLKARKGGAFATYAEDAKLT